MAKAANLSLDTMFGKLDTQVQPPKPTPIKDRPTLKLPPEIEEEFLVFIGFHSVARKIETQRRNQQEIVDRGCFDIYTKYLWDRKTTPPKNPKVEVNKDGFTSSAIFQVQERFKVNVDIEKLPPEQSPQDAVVKALVTIDPGCGLKEEDATTIVTNEIDFTPDRGFHPFTKIFQEGTDAQKESLLKLMRMITAEGGGKTGRITTEALTTEDRNNLMYNIPRAKVREPKQFLNRLPNYVNSLSQLRAALEVIKPTHVYPSHVNFMKGANIGDQISALQQVAVEMLGMKGD